MNETLMYILIIALLLIVVGVLIALWGKIKKPEDDKGMLLLQN